MTKTTMAKKTTIVQSHVGTDGKIYHKHSDGAVSHLGLPREKDIQKQILEFLDFKRILAYRQNSGAFVDKAKHFYRFASIDGLPDIVAIIGGRYIAIEVKKPGGKMRDSQKTFREALEESGGLYWLFDSLDVAVDTIDRYYSQHHV